MHGICHEPLDFRRSARDPRSDPDAPRWDDEGRAGKALWGCVALKLRSLKYDVSHWRPASATKAQISAMVLPALVKYMGRALVAIEAIDADDPEEDTELERVMGLLAVR